MKLLIAEDDAVISDGLEYSLKSEGYDVRVCRTYAEAVKTAESESFDLYLLDVGFPDGSGYDICRKVKKLSDAPVIFLTACDDEVNVVMGLEMGADDYISKPFRLRELISRIKSVLRRSGKLNNEKIITIGNVKMCLSEGKVYKNNQDVFLTAMEYRLLLVFINNPGKILSRNNLLENIWDVSGDFVNDNTLTVYIKRLREKIEDDAQNPKIIKTIRGLGYIMEY